MSTREISANRYCFPLTKSWVAALIALALTALAILAALAPATAFAASSDAVEGLAASGADTALAAGEVSASESVSGTVALDAADAPESDALFAAYVDAAFAQAAADAPAAADATLAAQSATAYAARSELSAFEQQLYDFFLPHVKAIAAGKETNTEFQIKLAPYVKGNYLPVRYSAAELGVKSIIDSDGELVRNAGQASFNILSAAMQRVLYALVEDCPYEMYWFDNVSGISMGLKGIRTVPDGGATFLTLKDATFTAKFNVSRDYSATGKMKTSKTKSDLARVKQAASNAATIVKLHAGEGDYQKLDSYRVEICNLSAYNDAAMADPNYPYGDPWQLVNLFDGDPKTTVVCEGYSKGFKYLCEKSRFSNASLACYTVDGWMQVTRDTQAKSAEGDHTWNIVSIDGKSYLVDLTNMCPGMIGGKSATEAGTALFMQGCDAQPKKPRAKASEGTYIVPGYGIKIASQKARIDYYYKRAESSVLDPAVLNLSKADYKPASGKQTAQKPRVSIAGATVAGLGSQAFTGKAITPKVTVKLGKTTLKAGAYTVKFLDAKGKKAVTPKNVGTYTVAVIGKGAYEGKQKVPFVITQAKAVKFAVSKVANQKSTGKAIKPALTVKYNGAKLKAGTDYTLAYKNNVKPGVAKIVITGKGNFTGTKTVTL